MNGIGIVCEGGGLRGIYTAGVLDFFLDKSLEFNYLVGVSAGAIYPASYISRQNKRILNIQKKYLNDKRYMSLKSLIKTGSYVNYEFAFFKMSHELFPIDYKTFKRSNTDFKIGMFNCLSGETDYISKEDLDGIDQTMTALIASGSLPFISKEIIIDNVPYLDGGIAAPIPIDKSIKDKNNRHIVILTQGEGYEKSPLSYPKFAKLYYKGYPKVAKALIKRHEVYNSSLEKVEKLSKDKSVFIIRPSKKIRVSRLEKDIKKVENLYKLGYDDAKKNYDGLLKWINKK